MICSEERWAHSGPYTAAKLPYGEFLDAGGPFQATAKLIWERFFFISRPRAHEACETRAVTPRNNS
ncbi:hypothetical protein D7I41_16940 [Ochrobactrum sp. MH181795]|uniref:Uncharacterized protein n=1 Tax=Brucella lupini TaxID=255457 RepID=A0A256GA85_9HYPH|nr:hypothetical protein CES86_5161 [Brucella lupini]RCI78076.1 hypothetical protein DNK03_16700 [Brucella anthropi]RNL42796.1 hypothetical protein D7I41_16940 [Ochrobactrum sp. MH181795]